MVKRPYPVGPGLDAVVSGFGSDAGVQWLRKTPEAEAPRASPVILPVPVRRKCLRWMVFMIQLRSARFLDTEYRSETCPVTSCVWSRGSFECWIVERRNFNSASGHIGSSR